MITFNSLFAGIGGMDLGLERAGLRCVCQVEIDGDCNGVLARHFPAVPRHRDIKEVKPDGLPRVDVLAGGVPCQDWSVAGRRAGLAGERSGLFFEFARLADALAPRWVLFENVPGLLSACGCPECVERKQNGKGVVPGHGGRDFALVLEALAGFWPEVPEGGWRNSGVCVGPKRGVAWRVLDAQYFGVAQRRRRVFLVASPGDGCGPVQILFEPESCDGDSAPCRQEAAGAAARATPGAQGDSGRGRLTGGTPYIINAAEPCAKKDHARESDVARCLDQTGGFATNQGGTVVAFTELGEGHVTYQETDTAAPVKTNAGGSSLLNNVVAHCLKAEGADGSEDGTGRGVSLAVVPIDMRQASRGGKMTNNRREGSSGGAPGTGVGKPGDPAPTLADTHTPAIAWTQRTRADGANVECSEDVSFALDAPVGGGRKKGGVVTGTVVRRLTPLECERLQGFPDGWTAFDADGKPVSDGARYRMLGNAVAVPVAAWIGQRIAAMEGE